MRIVAEGLGLVAHLAENLAAEVTGRKRFRQYVLPVYSQFSAILKAKGKLLSAHCGGRLKSLVDDFAVSALDIIEAFCPFPDAGITVDAARRPWSGRSKDFSSALPRIFPAVFEKYLSRPSRPHSWNTEHCQSQPDNALRADIKL